MILFSQLIGRVPKYWEKLRSNTNLIVIILSHQIQPGSGFQPIILLKIFSGTPLDYYTIPQKITKMYKEVSEKDFALKVVNSPSLAVVKFRKTWNGACQIIEPVYSDLSKKYKDQAQFYSVDIEKASALEKQYSITEVPTILFFKGGQLLDHSIGLTSRNVLIDKIENLIL